MEEPKNIDGRTLGCWDNPNNIDIKKILTSDFYGVPPILGDCSVETAEGFAKKFLVNYLAEFQSHYDDGRGLFIYGDFGTGKSGMATAVLRQCLLWNLRIRYITCDDMIQAIVSRESTKDNIPISEYLKDVVDVLVLDDLKFSKATKYSAMSASLIEGVLKHRADHQKLTIVTCNSTLEEVKLKFGDAVSEIIMSTSIPVLLKDVKWRKKLKDKNLEFLDRYSSDS